MINNSRNLIKILKEISSIEGIEFNTFSSDWIIKLSNKYIFGYNFDINSSAASNICNDKSATYEILNAHNISAVRHDFIMSPKNIENLENTVDYKKILNLLKINKQIILKPNLGTGGEDIFLVKNENELKKKLNYLFVRYPSIAVSPYVDITIEYRVIVLNNDVKLIFSKNIPNTRQCNNHFKKFNLCQGAIPKLLEDKELTTKLSEIAINSSKVIGINFASVDIVEINGEYKVLEINSGVMMEHFSNTSSEFFEITKSIYYDAVKFMLAH